MGYRVNVAEGGSRKGKLAETLIAAFSVPGSDGVMDASTPPADGGGVDSVPNISGAAR